MTPAQKRGCAAHAAKMRLRGGGESRASARARILAQNLDVLENRAVPPPTPTHLSGGGGRNQQKPFKDFVWMTYRKARLYEAEAAELGVSQVARSSRGFMRHYEKMKTPHRMRQALVPNKKSQTWGRRRSAFIKRHLAQYKKKKTTGCISIASGCSK